MLNKKPNDNNIVIINSFENISTDLEKQISLITQRQQELQNYMVMIDNHINHFDQMIHKESQKTNPDYKKIANYRSASFKNIELMTVLHNSYKEYEAVKFRYFKEISDNNYKKQKLINVDIKRIGTNEQVGAEFYDIMRNLSKLNMTGDIAKKQLGENNALLNVVQTGLSEEEYQM